MTDVGAGDDPVLSSDTSADAPTDMSADAPTDTSPDVSTDASGEPDDVAPGGEERAPRVGDAVAVGVSRTPLEMLNLSPETWRIVAVAGVEMELPTVNPEVVLHEAQDPWRELRIPVGMAEGTAIAFAHRGIDTPRPLTHELVTDILDRHDVSIEAVRITVRRGQVFFAEIDTMGPRGRRVLPCRPSDAIALALRQTLPTPILVAEWVFTGANAPSEVVSPPPPGTAVTGPSI
jgi:bifunctional DNase/RNase